MGTPSQRCSKRSPLRRACASGPEGDQSSSWRPSSCQTGRHSRQRRRVASSPGAATREVGAIAEAAGMGEGGAALRCVVPLASRGRGRRPLPVAPDGSHRRHGPGGASPGAGEARVCARQSARAVQVRVASVGRCVPVCVHAGGRVGGRGGLRLCLLDAQLTRCDQVQDTRDEFYQYHAII